MPANVETMAYVGAVPWHGQGAEVPPHVTAHEMIRAAGLDWEVEKRPARGSKRVSEKEEPDRFSRYEVVRVPRPGFNEEEVVLGLVSNRYEPLQNIEAFEFFDPIVDRDTATYETAGALGDGERVWVMAKMPHPIKVAPDDECGKYLLLSNSHNGQGSVIVKFTAVRVVCQNTLTMALKDGNTAYRVRHSSRMGRRLEEVANLMSWANETYKEAERKFRQLAATQIRGREMLEKYLVSLFPLSDAQKRDGTHSPKWDFVTELLESSPDLQMPGVRGTMWAAYNAVTRFEDYREVQGETESNRLNRVWFGASAGLKMRALDEAVRIATEN